MVNEDAALLNRHVTQVTPPHFSAAVYTYTGTAKCASATTIPSGLDVVLAYDGSPACPTNPGSYTVIGTITATNYQGSTTNTLVIGCPTISLASLAQPALGVTYTAAATASGGMAPYTYGLIAGNLPAGMTLNTNTGTVSGSPTSAGTFAFTLQATDSFGCTGTNAYSFTTTCPQLALSGLADAYLGIACNQSATATGGFAPYSYSPSGTLPPGLSLATNGVLSGTPTSNGVYTFTITATDAYGCSGSSNYTVAVSCPTIALAALPDANLGVAYDQTPTASGGVAPYTYSLISGTLPPGLSLATNGSISGVPLAFATNSLTITATDANGCSGSQDYAFAVTGSGDAGDTNPPTVTITSPANNSLVTNGSLTVSGAAADNSGTPNTGVALVFYSLNGGAQQLATGKTGWSASVSLAVGTNILVAQAVDYRGNVSTPATNKVFYAVRTVFTVITNGVGKVALSPAPPVYVGRDYTFTVTPSSAVTNFFLLSNIVNEATSGVTETKFYKYTFQAESTNRITINFVTNRFLNAAGMYQGLFAAEDVNRRSAGLVVLRTQGKATYSGYINVAGDKIALTGLFDLSGEDYAKTLVRPGKAALQVSLRLNFDDTMWGTISCPDEGWTAPLEAYKAVFTAAQPATNYIGRYNIALPGQPGDATVPAGAGYLRASISSLGAVFASATLADDVKLTTSAVISKDGQWPLFLDLGSRYPGMVIGWIQFSNNAALAPVAGDLFWVKEGGASGYYNAGFTNAAIAATGSVFVPGSALDLTAATLVLADGNLTAPLSNLLVVTNGNQLQLVTTNGSPKLFYYPATGLLLGTFNHPVTGQRGVKLNGIYEPGENRFHGYFLGTNQSGSLTIEAD